MNLDYSDVQRKVEQWIPNDDLRRECLTILAEAVELADQLSRNNWSLTFPGGNYMRLNVAKVEVITLNPDGFRIIVDGNAMSFESINRLQSAGIHSVDSEYKSVPGSKLRIDIPLHENHLYREYVRNANHAYIRKASATPSGKNQWSAAHSPALIEYLNEYLNIDLRQPAYLNDLQSPISTRRIWLLAAGQKGKQWNDFLADNSAQIDYLGMGDLRKYETREEMRKVLSYLFSDGQKNPMHDSLACWQFVHEMNVGDVVVAKAGIDTVLGFGVVSGPYTFAGEESTVQYKHRRAVNWIKEGKWVVTWDKKMVTKTLTDITNNQALLDSIEQLIGEDLHDVNNIETPSYWWLNCNPEYWNLKNMSVGEKHSYATYNERGTKHRVAEYFAQVKPGDFLIGYETTPKKRVTALLRITQALQQIGDREQFIFEKVADATKEVRWENLIVDEILQSAEPIKNNQGSLFRLTEQEYLKLSGLAAFDWIGNGGNISSPLPDDEAPSVSLEEVADTLFVASDEIERWKNALRRKKQMIFYGPPGTGKTFSAKQFARHLIGEGRGFMDIVQFHPSYGYEDFVQGIRPVSNENGSFSYTIISGVFKTFCEEASALGKDDICVLILDEINRANLSRVFGELMYLLEYRDESVRLAGDGRTFKVPENVRIIGTMNTADRSIALVDHALRRRFAFIELAPDYEVLRRWHRRSGTGFNPDGLIGILQQLNTEIGDSHYEVGISFFLLRDIQGDIEHIWRMEIEPYVKELFFDQTEKAKKFSWSEIAKRVLP